MKPKVLLARILVLVIAVSACTSPTGTSTPTITPMAVLPGYHLLVGVGGVVQLKREGWTEYFPTSFGAILHRGDLLKPSSGAKVIVLCDNLSVWNVPTGGPSGVSNGCTQGNEPALSLPNSSRVGHTRSSDISSIPYIISPRATVLLSERPTLRWNTVPTATQYIISISAEDLVWETETNQTELVYPMDQPPLKPGIVYSLSVEANNGKRSQDEGVPGLGFSLIDKGQAQQVIASSEKLAGLALSKESWAYAQAQIYTSHGLIAEAIEVLETQVEAGSQAAAIFRMLGDLYQKIGLNSLAEAPYVKAIELAQTSGDVEGLAAAQASLGEVYIALGNSDQAVQLLTRAQAGFAKLGDMQRANQIEPTLETIIPK